MSDELTPPDWEQGYKDLKRTLADPPEGWYTFGTFADEHGIELEFWGDDHGTPFWERPVPLTITMEQFEEARFAYVEAWENAEARQAHGELTTAPGIRSTIGMIAALRVLGIERQPKRELL